MKIILLKDVAKLGKKFDVKTVADGHALNQLIPRGLAQVATPALVKKVELMKAEEAKKMAEENARIAVLMGKIKGAVVHVEEKANEKGVLFSSIPKGIVVKRLSDVVGAEIPADIIQIPAHLKEVGEHTVEARHNGTSVKFSVVVVAQK